MHIIIPVSYTHLYYCSRLVNESTSEDTNPEELMKLLTSMMSNNMEKNPYLKQSEWSWTIDEIGFRIALNDIYRRYKKPIIILECGIGVDEKLNDNMSVDDDYRIDYFKNHLVEMKKAIEIDGVDCFGSVSYTHLDVYTRQSLCRDELKSIL